MNRKLLILVFGLVLAGVSRAQTAHISSNPVSGSGCAPLIVVFKDATTGGTATSWSWTFPGGVPAISNGSPSQNVTFNNPGTYTVTLTINGGGSPNLTATEQIIVWTPPSSNFSVAGDSVGCFPFLVQFLSGATPGSAPIVTYNWGFGDGNVSPLKNPKHTYLTQAEFPVTLQVVDANGCANVSSITHYIIITGGVTASFSTIASSGCSLPVTIQLNNTSSGVPGIANNYTWTFGDGSPLSHAISPPHTYTSSGNYPIILVAQSPAGCTASDTVNTQITAGNVSSSFNAPDSVCVNSPINFQNTSTPAPTVSNWSF
ncbi:MAG TPA: PKD domain-containing protein, partial [Puia sp.]|nr:PKD domain-containing protein [Puia sp.]